MVNTSEAVLLRIADCYEKRVARRGGKSLTRVATIVASRGSFFAPLREGKTCTVRNLDAFCAYFSTAANWPDQVIPRAAVEELARLGHHVSGGALQASE
jgi:hypothetical protein